MVNGFFDVYLPVLFGCSRLISLARPRPCNPDRVIWELYKIFVERFNEPDEEFEADELEAEIIAELKLGVGREFYIPAHFQSQDIEEYIAMLPSLIKKKFKNAEGTNAMLKMLSSDAEGVKSEIIRLLQTYKNSIDPDNKFGNLLLVFYGNCFDPKKEIEYTTKEEEARKWSLYPDPNPDAKLNDDTSEPALDPCKDELERIEKLQKSYDHVSFENADLQKEVDDLRKKNRDLEVNNNRFAKQANVYESEMKKLKDMEEENKYLKKQLADCQNKYAQLLESSRRQALAPKQLEEEEEEEAGVGTSLADQIAEAEPTPGYWKAEYEKTAANLTELQQKWTDSLTKTLTDKSDDWRKCEQQLTEATEELDKSKSIIKELEEAHRQSTIELVASQTSLKEVKAALSLVQEQYERCKKGVSSEEIKELRNDIKFKEARMMELMEENEALKKKQLAEPQQPSSVAPEPQQPSSVAPEPQIAAKPAGRKLKDSELVTPGSLRAEMMGGRCHTDEAVTDERCLKCTINTDKYCNLHRMKVPEGSAVGDADYNALDSGTQIKLQLHKARAKNSEEHLLNARAIASYRGYQDGAFRFLTDADMAVMEGRMSLRKYVMQARKQNTRQHYMEEIYNPSPEPRRFAERMSTSGTPRRGL